MSQQAAQKLDDLIDRLYKALEIKFRSVDDAFSSILPDRKTGFNGHLFIPLPTGSGNYRRINLTWKDFFYAQQINNAILNNKGLRISTDVDNIVGEAIHDRLRSSLGIQDPKPYEHQAEAIGLALYAVDKLRDWLRHNKVNVNVQGLNLSPAFDVVALLAPTASGKTEFLEAITLQLVLDAKMAGFTATKALLIYPMREFMRDHARRFIRDLTYINGYLMQRGLPPITIGVLNQDTPSQSMLRSSSKAMAIVKDHLSTFFDENPATGSLLCPLHGKDLTININTYGQVNIRCPNGHSFDFIQVTRDEISSQPPDILFITPDMLNRILTMPTHRYYGSILGWTLNGKGFPLIIGIDEPHLYSGVFGANVSLLLRSLRTVISESANIRGKVTYRPLFIATSATIPNAKVFLSKLLAINDSRIWLVTTSPPQSSRGVQQPFSSSKGLIALLPKERVPNRQGKLIGWGISNASVEIIPVLAALLPPDERKILVFVDSVEEAERLRYEIEDYISRDDGFWQEYDVCNNVLNAKGQGVFHPSVCPQGKANKNFISVGALTAKMDRSLRVSTIQKFRSSPPSVHVLIATSALEVGVDIADVNYVVLRGLPPTPTSFEQRAGRVGRRGQTSLVVVIGDEHSGVDTYYLSNLNNLLSYINSSRNYDLPLNPANPQAIRAYAANFIYIMNQLSGGKLPTLSNVFGLYKKLAIYDPINELGSSGGPVGLVAKYLNSAQQTLSTQLTQLAHVINQTAYPKKGVPRSFNAIFVIFWKLVATRWSQLANISPPKMPLEDLRSSSSSVTIELYIQRKPVIRFNDDILPALSTYCGLRRFIILPTTGMFYTVNLHRSGGINPGRLHGVITLKSVPVTVGGRRTSLLTLPFEASGGRFGDIPIRTDLHHLQSLHYGTWGVAQTYKELYDYLSLQKRGRTLNSIYNILTYLSRKFYMLAQLAAQRPLPPNIVAQLNMFVPHELRFQALDPICYIDRNNNLSCGQLNSTALQNVKSLLNCFEIVQPAQASRSVYVNKLNPNVMSSAPPGRVQSFSCKGGNLVLHILSNNQGRTTVVPWNYVASAKKASANKANISVTNILRSYGVAINIPHNDRSLLDKKCSAMDLRLQKSSQQPCAILASLKSKEVLVANIGFYVSVGGLNIRGLPRRVSFLVPTRDNRRDQVIIGTNLETNALELTMNWGLIFNEMGRLYGGFDKFVKDALSCVPPGSSIAQSLSQNPATFQRYFKLITSHSLAHMLLNFHSLYTGGGKTELSEAISFSGNDVINVILFDAADGGNGVSELLYYHLNDVLNDALNVMLGRHLRASSPVDRFYGEPGDVVLGTWPSCRYGPPAVSRYMVSRCWLLMLLAAMADPGYTLQQLVQLYRNKGSNLNLKFF